jgi:hypothetical protein
VSEIAEDILWMQPGIKDNIRHPGLFPPIELLGMTVLADLGADEMGAFG